MNQYIVQYSALRGSATNTATSHRALHFPAFPLSDYPVLVLPLGNNGRGRRAGAATSRTTHTPPWKAGWVTQDANVRHDRGPLAMARLLTRERVKSSQVNNGRPIFLVSCATLICPPRSPFS